MAKDPHRIGKGSKKALRSARNKRTGKYAIQRFRTERNKSRRASGGE